MEFFHRPDSQPAHGRGVRRGRVRVSLPSAPRSGLALAELSPIAVATYIDEMHCRYSASTIKQHLAAIRRLCDWLVIGQVVPANPAASVRGPTHVVRTGKTPVLQPADARLLRSLTLPPPKSDPALGVFGSHRPRKTPASQRGHFCRGLSCSLQPPCGNDVPRSRWLPLFTDNRMGGR